MAGLSAKRVSESFRLHHELDRLQSLTFDTLTDLAVKLYHLLVLSANGRSTAFSVHWTTEPLQRMDRKAGYAFAVRITPGIPDLMRRCASGYGKKME